MADEKPLKRTCRLCGCTDDCACVDDQNFPCAWVEDDLCTACAVKIEDDGFITVHPDPQNTVARPR